MGLHSLRQHLSIIPQTPFLFRGTISQNIDPFGSTPESQLWEALDASGLSSHVRSVHLD